MIDANHIRHVYERYSEMVTKGDVEGIVELYTEDATIEDPIGSDLRRGRDAIREFYKAAAGTITMKRSGPVRVAGNEAATPLLILMGPEGLQLHARQPRHLLAPRAERRSWITGSAISATRCAAYAAAPALRWR